MSDNLILDFPILRKDSSDFSAEISYEAEACQDNGKLYVTHSLKGRSFISNLIENGKARFSVRLLYRESSERQYHPCCQSIPMRDNAIIVEQIVPKDFSYAPEVITSIVALEDEKITVGNASGLTDFWEQGECFSVPQYARIAIAPKLTFSKGDVSHLMRMKYDAELGDGEMKVTVNEYAGEDETPVCLLCGKGVFDQLSKDIRAEPSNADESMSLAIVTQALCATYAYMQNLDEDKRDEVGGVLSSHLEMLESKTGENWGNESFNPSLAATKMQPYVLSVFKGEAGDE